jgi:hypothetical protein
LIATGTGQVIFAEFAVAGRPRAFGVVPFGEPLYEEIIKTQVGEKYAVIRNCRDNFRQSERILRIGITHMRWGNQPSC